MIEGETIKWPPERDKNTNNGLQNTTQNINDRATRTPLTSEQNNNVR